MRTILLTTAAALLGTGLAHGQYVNVQQKKVGTQVISEIQEVKPPPAVEVVPAPDGKPVQAGQPAPGGPVAPSAKSMVLSARDWRCGMYFTDDEGRRWKLVRGQSVTDQPLNLSGWRLITADGEHNFFTVGGRLFVRQ